MGRSTKRAGFVSTPETLRRRTKAFALRVIRLVQSLAPGRVADVRGKQLLRSGTSVGANCRAACRARSRAEFVAKMGIVEEEADETIYWMELLGESGLMPSSRLRSLMDEASELVAIAVSSIRSARK
ncbi:MAG: four helix bundle protein [Planctomycetes bacterium]|nr:four helix bundle protein [Planctomycetota bacterium]